MPSRRTKSRIRPKTKERYKQAMRDVVDGLGRKVLIYKQPILSECPNCYFDKMTNRSTGKCKWTSTQAMQKQDEWEADGNNTIRYKYFKFGRCPVCHGKGYLEAQRKTWANCIVNWNPSERRGGNLITYTPAGTEGSTVVRLKCDPKYYDAFKNSSKLVIDGIECKLSRPPVLRGLGTQTLLIVYAFTTEKPQIDSGEIIKDY
jgi:hypothetical protein